MAVALRVMGSRFVVVGCLLLAACAAPEDAEPSEETATSAAAPIEASTPSATMSTPARLVAPKAPTCGPSGGPSRAEQVCWRWHCDGDAKARPSWNGAAATCRAGDLDANAAEQALRRINVHRFLADLPAFTQEATWTDAAQECALIAHANQKLSHEPPRSWDCWNKPGANVAAGSLVANVSVVPSIAAYMEDPGNETTMVHRRWLLDETLSSVGFGSTDKYSCLVVDGRSVSRPVAAKSKDVRGWSAWPPAGPVPFDVFETEKLDTAGWTVQSTKNDLANATVKVTRDGVDMPVAVTKLADGQGSRTAIRFVPQGWVTEAGRSYAVAVHSSAAALEFTVQPIACVD